MEPEVGVLAIQGDYEAHAKALARAGAGVRLVREPKELDGLDALVLPGGESTTIAKGIERLGLQAPLRAFVESGHPVLGTCAGAILLARAVEHHPVPCLGLVDVVAVRNAYGTQVDSFIAPADPGAAAGLEGLRCVFIRAPRLRVAKPSGSSQPGPDVEVLARVDGEPVLVRQGDRMAATFHPELGDDVRVHALLVEAARRRTGAGRLASR